MEIKLSSLFSNTLFVVKQLSEITISRVGKGTKLCVWVTKAVLILILEGEPGEKILHLLKIIAIFLPFLYFGDSLYILGLK